MSGASESTDKHPSRQAIEQTGIHAFFLDRALKRKLKRRRINHATAHFTLLADLRKLIITSPNGNGGALATPAEHKNIQTWAPADELSHNALSDTTILKIK